ncbi:MAG: hypothetical protein JXA21_10760 [Anaerolineae bacterium]|nr:hypothetical protein [Anaerolineae bacterium]
MMEPARPDPQWVEPNVNPNPPDRGPFLFGPRKRLQRRPGVTLARFALAALLLGAAVVWIALSTKPVDFAFFEDESGGYGH